MIWPCLRVVLSLGFAMVLGFSVVRTLCDTRRSALSRTEMAGYSFVMGLGLLPAGMLLLSALDVRFSLGAVLAFVVLPVALFVFRKRFPRSRAPEASTEVPAHTFVSTGLVPRWFMILVLAVFVAFVFLGCFLEPVSEVDSLAAWAFHAKVFFYDRSAFPEILTSGAGGPGVSYWPPLFPLIQTWAHIAMGTYDDSAVKLISPFCYVALLTLLYASLARFVRPSYALAMVCILATVPVVVVPFPAGSVASGYADVPMALFVMAVTSSLLLWMTSKDTRIIVLAALFSAFLLWIKREGLVLGLFSAVLVWVFMPPSASRRRLLQPAIYDLIVLGSLGLQALYKSHFPGGLLGWPVDLSRIHSAEGIARFLVSVKFLVLEAANPSHWGFLWLVLAVLVLLRLRHVKVPVIGLPLLLVAGHLFPALVCIAASDYSLLRHAALDMRRVLIHVAPAAVLTIGLLSTIRDRGAVAP